MLSVRAVIFDLAGTTVDFGSCAPVAALRGAFAQYGIDLSTTEARANMGLPKLDHIAATLRIPRVAEAWEGQHGLRPHADDVQRVFEVFVPLQLECIERHSDVIPGVLRTVETLRSHAIRIASTTGYTRQMVTPLLRLALAGGYSPDVTMTPDDVGAGRPAPFMIWQAAVALQVWPLRCIVKIGDTPVDVDEGRNAGVWSVGVAVTGNEMGLSRAEFDGLTEAERKQRTQAAMQSLSTANPHYVVESVANVPDLILEISRRVELGEKP